MTTRAISLYWTLLCMFPVAVQGQKAVPQCESYSAFWADRAGAGPGGPPLDFPGYHGLQQRSVLEWDNATGEVHVRSPITVARVFCDSPSAAAGVLAGDEIISVNGVTATEEGVLAPRSVGMVFELVLRRGEHRFDATFTTVPRPPLRATADWPQCWRFLPTDSAAVPAWIFGEVRYRLHSDGRASFWVTPGTGAAAGELAPVSWTSVDGQLVIRADGGGFWWRRLRISEPMTQLSAAVREGYSDNGPVEWRADGDAARIPCGESEWYPPADPPPAPQRIQLRDTARGGG